MRAKLIAAIVLTLTGIAFGQAVKPAAQLVDIGKKATVLVTFADGSATSFCIDKSGLFITNNHVVKRAGAGLTLVLNSGEENELRLAGNVVRADEKTDLALVSVRTDRELTALELGVDEGLIETTEVVAFGYPFGKMLAEKGGNPSVTVSMGRITSLRSLGGKLSRIQLDASLNPGNSGGPVLGPDGKVIGLVHGGIFGASTNFAIPVSVLRDFLDQPELAFTPPTIDSARKGERTDLAVKLISPLRPAAEYIVVVTVSGVGEQRKMTMIQTEDTFKISFVPVPPKEGPVELSVSARLGQDMVSGRVEDTSVRVADRAVQLSEIRRIESGRTLMADGTTLDGPVDLKAVTMLLGEQAVTLDLSRAENVEVRAPVEPNSLQYVVQAMLRGRVVAEKTASSAIVSRMGGRSTSMPPALAAGEGPVPTVISGVVERKLPDTIADVVAAGGGRYLILHLPKLRKLAILDTACGEIVKYLSLDSDDVMYAATMHKLFLVMPGKQVVQRFAVGTWERELVSTIDENISAIVAGHSSTGPVVVAGGPGGLSFLNPQDLRLSPVASKGHRGFVSTAPARFQMRIAADGSALGVWRLSVSPSGVFGATIGEDGTAEFRYSHTSAGAIVPSPDGRVLHTNVGMFDVDKLTIVGGEPTRRGRQSVPAYQGNYYVEPNRTIVSSPGPSRTETSATLAICLRGETRPLLAVPDLSYSLTGGTSSMTLDKRVHLIPAANLLVLIPSTNDRVVLREFDLLQELSNSEIDYLFVSSIPPLTAARGTLYRYKLVVQSRRGGARLTLESGPDGMRLSPDGELTWPVPNDGAESTVNVIVRVTDNSDQENFHTFKVRVR